MNHQINTHLINLHKQLSDLIYSTSQLIALSQHNLNINHLHPIVIVPYSQFLKALDHLSLKLVSFLNCYLPVLDLFKNNIILPFDTLGHFDNTSTHFIPEWISTWLHPDFLHSSSLLINQSKSDLANSLSNSANHQELHNFHFINPTSTTSTLSPLNTPPSISITPLNLDPPINSVAPPLNLDESLLLEQIKARSFFHDLIVNSVVESCTTRLSTALNDNAGHKTLLQHERVSSHDLADTNYSSITNDSDDQRTALLVKDEMGRPSTRFSHLIHSSLKFIAQPYSK